MYKAQSPKSPDTAKAVHYFQHFPSNFLRPYGLADSRPTEHTIFHRVAPLNCEWLLRPRVAASEFADTMEQNLKYLAENDSSIVKNDAFQDIETTLLPFISSLKKLNTTNDEGPATPSDVKQLIKTMVTDDEEIDSFHNMVKIGGAMFLLGTHYSVVKTLMTNPEWYAEKAVGTTKEVADFKQNPTIKGLKQFLTSTCTNQEHQPDTNRSKAKQNLAALLESSEDEEEARPKTTKKNKRKGQKQTQQASSSSAQSSVLADECPPAKKAKKSKKDKAT